MIELDKIGAVLAFRHLGVPGICGQTVGADGAGRFCVIFLGNPFDAETAARTYVEKLYQSGAKICDVCVVANHDGYLGHTISIVEAGK